MARATAAIQAQQQGQSAGQDDTTANQVKTLVIPEEVQSKFPELVELIKGSKSMNDEERQYWVDVLPVMSEDQVKNLRGILDNEKKQLAEAAAAYSKKVEDEERKAAQAFDEAAYLEKKRMREQAEAHHEAKEKAMEEDILSELANL